MKICPATANAVCYEMPFYESMVLIFLILGMMVFFGFVLDGFFKTSKGGFGRFTSSTLIIIIVLMVSLIALLLGGINGDDITKIILAIIGFVAGVVAGKEASRSESSDDTSSH